MWNARNPFRNLFIFCHPILCSILIHQGRAISASFLVHVIVFELPWEKSEFNFQVIQACWLTRGGQSIVSLSTEHSYVYYKAEVETRRCIRPSQRLHAGIVHQAWVRILPSSMWRGDRQLTNKIGASGWTDAPTAQEKAPSRSYTHGAINLHLAHAGNVGGRMDEIGASGWTDVPKVYLYEPW